MGDGSRWGRGARRAGRTGARRIALAYLLAASLWILLSDRLVLLLAGEPDLSAQLQTAKGLFYVLATAVLLYWLIRRYSRSLEAAYGDLQATVESMADGVLMVAPPGEVVAVNRAGLLLLGAEESEILGPLAAVRARLRRADGGALEPADDPLQAALAGRLEVGRELRVDRGSLGFLDLSVSAAPVLRDGSIGLAVAVLRDVSELRRLERLRDEFLATAAHELKTPVTALKGYVQLLRRWAPEERQPREREALVVLDRQCDRIARVVDEILQVSRLQAGSLTMRPEPFDLGELAERQVARMQAVAEGHRLRLERRGRAPVVADRDRIGQVLVNLLDNAVRFSPAGSEVRITVEVVGPEARVEIADRGAGIPAEWRPEVFERFFRAHGDQGAQYLAGLGIGLHLSREIVERQGGRIGFESEEGRGSTFFFSLPSAPAESG